MARAKRCQGPFRPPSLETVPDTVSAGRRVRWTTFLVSSAIVLAAALLHLGGDGRLALPGGVLGSLPGLCLTRSVAHMDCPGCGMTRSFVAMAHGDLRQAFRSHRLGPPLFLLVLAQVPLGALALLRPIRGHDPTRPYRMGIVSPDCAGLLVTLALVANWAYNLATGAAFH
jgi:hypothetical protein